MERLDFETLLRVVIWDYNRCFKDESLDKDLFIEKYGKVMGEHYYNKFVHEFNGNILKMVGYFRGSEKEGQVFCDMITECIGLSCPNTQIRVTRIFVPRYFENRIYI